MSKNWIIAGVAAVCFVTGIALSHRIEPGVRVEKIMLTTNTPALRIFPATPGQHPIALLAHGCTGSKEMLFRFGEALAAAGFECYSVDQAGHGESPQPCSLTNIHADGSVTGTVGDAKFTEGRFESNRGWLGRKLNLWSDYIITGGLDGAIIVSSSSQVAILPTSPRF